MNERRLYHLPLSEGGLGPLREVTVGVCVNNEGASRVVASESAAVLADSLFVQSSCCLAYVYLITTPTGYAVHLAEGSVVV